MSDKDDFDAIVNNQPQPGEPDEGEQLTHIWEAIESLWPHFYDGILIKGVIVAEYIDARDGGRVLRFISSPDMAPWDTLGMLESARMDARDLSSSATMFAEEDEDEDE